MRLRVMALGLGVLAAGTVAEAAVMSLKAAKKNGVAITPPTNNLTVVGGDKIEAEIFLSSWLNDLPLGVRGFQAVLEGRLGFASGDNGTVLPEGWCAPLDQIACLPACPPDYPFCVPPWSCTCAGHNPECSTCAFMRQSRSDFLFFEIDWFPALSTQTVNYKYVGIRDAPVGVPDTGVPRYLGSVVLKVSPNACGTFTIGFRTDQGESFIADRSNFTVIPTSQPLRLTVSPCTRQLLSCAPAHCNIDARIAHDRNNQDIRLNANTILARFSSSTAGMTPSDFEITLIPSGGTVPTVTSVLLNLNDATVVLGARIPQTRWTCVRDKGSNKRCCMGSLPGDADGDKVSRPDDTFEVYDNLQGGVSPALAIEKCDTDRSTRCAPADLLMVVDLLNGAGAFDEVRDDTLPDLVPACPSMVILP